MNWIFIFVGGGIGALLRHALTVVIEERTVSGFPWGTFTVNAVGCLAIGLLAVLLETRIPASATTRSFIFVGVLGGFTTFSTFGLQIWGLLETGHLWIASAYSFGSLAIAFVGVAAGVALARSIT